jgi:Tfp pilus assembly protein PilF
MSVKVVWKTGLVFVALCMAVLTASRFRANRSIQSTPLKHFDGSIERGSFQERDPEIADLYERAAGAIEEGDSATAERHYRELVAKRPFDAVAHESLATALTFRGDLNGALQEYSRAVSLDPGSAGAHYGLGSVAYRQRRFPDAQTHLEAAIKLKEDYGPTHRLLGLVHLEAGNASKALQHLERASSLDPSIAAENEIKTRIEILKAQVLDDDASR